MDDDMLTYSMQYIEDVVAFWVANVNFMHAQRLCYQQNSKYTQTNEKININN